MTVISWWHGTNHKHIGESQKGINKMKNYKVIASWNDGGWKIGRAHV